MANYQVTLMVSERLPATVEKKLREVFKDVPVHTVEKLKTPESRADRLSEAEGMVDDAFNIVEELKEEMENWRDTIPENLHGGDKYSQVEEAINGLEEIADNLSSGRDSMGSVEFPGMMG